MAAKYRKIDPRIWRDERVSRLEPLGKLVAVHCITESNRIGIFNFSVASACEDLGIDPKRYRILFNTVCDTLLWRWDEGLRVVYLPTWWRYNHPDNPKAMKGCLSDLDDLPISPLLNEFYSNTRYLAGSVLQVFNECIAYRIANGRAYQEQEQEQEQDTPLPPVGGIGEVSSEHAEKAPTEAQFMSAWNALPKPFPKIHKMSPTRQRALRCRCGDVFWLENWRAALDRLPRSPFLRGENKTGWTADPDFFLRPDSVLRIIEGKYDSKPRQENGAQPKPTREESEREAAEKNRRVRERYGSPPEETPL